MNLDYLSNRWGSRKLAARSEDVARRTVALEAFTSLYESLIATVYEAARYGPVEGTERHYASLRVAVARDYMPLKPYLSAYLRNEPSDADTGIRAAGYSTDAFEALVAAPSLSCMLQFDDRQLISRITRTREAINLYGEHLRRLAARS